MSLKELKEIVRQMIGSVKTKEAIERIIKWAQENHQEQLIKDISILKGDQSDLNRKGRLGLLSNTEASTKQNNINYSVLDLLDHINIDNPIEIIDGGNPLPGRVKILMLTANPAFTTKLNLDKEYTVISQKLQEHPDFFNIILKKAVSGTEFKEFTQEEKPEILHFSGHGAEGKYAGIVVQNDDKNDEAVITTNGLRVLFKFFKKHVNIKVVLLNACSTKSQAAIIAEYVDYVIGTSVAISDTAASAFSSGFYFQLARGKKMKIEDAFDSGRTEAVMKGAEEENFVLYRNGELVKIA